MQLKYHLVNDGGPGASGAFSAKIGSGAGLILWCMKRRPSVQPKVWPAPHRLSSDGKVPVVGLFVWHPFGAADQGAVRGQQRVSLVSGHQFG